MKKSIFLITFLLYSIFSQVSSGPTPKDAEFKLNLFDYYNLGKDWPDICATGITQSPINFQTNLFQAKDDLKMKYVYNQTSQKIVLQKGNSIKAFGKFGELYIEDIDGEYLGYDANDFHIHAPSEHTIDDRYYEAEIHFVHKIKSSFEMYTNYKFAVISVFLEVSYEPNARATFLDDIDITKVNGEVFDFDLAQTLKDSGLDFNNADFMAYRGSLTTPPCTELVNWYVLKIPALIDYKTEAYILNSYYKTNSSFASLNGNNRFRQP